MKEVLKNQNYSELKYNFANFINRLDAVLIKDTSGVDFMIEFVDHALKGGTKNPLKSKNKSNEARYLNGEKLSKPKAQIIKDNFDRKMLKDYLDKIFDNGDNDDNVNDLCEEFFPNNQNITFKNLSDKLAKMFLEIIRNRISEKDPRANADDEVLYSLENEKDFEDKIQKTVKALCEIKSDDELEERPLAATYIRKKIPDDFFLCDDVQHKITRFYVKINQYFVNEQREGAMPTDFILKKVNRQYKELKKSSVNKQQIFDSMSQFFLSQAKLSSEYLIPAKCIVSYFIQLCEVFDAPSE